MPRIAIRYHQIVVTWVALLMAAAMTPSVLAETYDVVVYGGTPGGLAAGIAAKRAGGSVAIIEPTRWIGGLVTGGLTRTDFGKQQTVGGIAREFFARAAERYPKEFMWYAEPHVNLETFQVMLREENLDVVTGQRLESIQRDGPRITSLRTTDGTTYAGRVFIDASYEGDLLAAAGVDYIVGRESREQYGEELAGFYPREVRGFTHEVMTQGCPCVGGEGPHFVHGAPMKISAYDDAGNLLWGIRRSTATPGSADKLTQAYCYRLCVTQRPEILVPWPQPQRYDPQRYELLWRLIEAYPGIPFSRLVHLGRISNGKYDLNAQGLFSTDYVGGNDDWPDGDAATRERIAQDHVDYLQGFFWFLSHDPRVPQKLRDEVNTWGLCRDEFTDNHHWPYALYVREGRRMVGEYVMRQQDLQQEITKPDSVAMGSFVIDSHIVQRIVDETDGTVLDEGAFDGPSQPYQIAYRSLLPRREQCENLLVPVCLSASHVACCSIRMEPVYMALGHAGGIAAVVAARSEASVHDIDVPALQATLREQQQILELENFYAGPRADDLPGIVLDDSRAELSGFWKTSTWGASVNGASHHDGDFGKGEKTARYALTVPQAGSYEVRLSYNTAGNRATRVPVTIEHAGGTEMVYVNQRKEGPIDKLFVSLGTFQFAPERPAVITISNRDTDGYVVADAVQLLAGE